MSDIEQATAAPGEKRRVRLLPHRVAEKVTAIAAIAGDDEMAHSREDALHREVLQAIANGAPDAPTLAAEALKTRDIDFSRWCA